MRKWYDAWKQDLLKHKFLILLSIIILVLANYASYFASMHVDKVNAISVPDLILDHIPIINLEFIFIYGIFLVVVAIIIYSIIFNAKNLHCIIFQFSLLILMRSFFIVLTHLAVPTGAVLVDDAPSFLSALYFKNDLFFSGHTAIPFMAFLLFRKNNSNFSRKIAMFFLAMSFVLAATVLLMHVHYSIDVFAAFFITYGTFHIGEWICRKCAMKKIAFK